MSKNTRKKILALNALVLSSGLVGINFTSNGAYAGTGGSDYAGILYGQDAAYCDSQGVSLTKTDKNNGMPLAGAVFSIKNTSTLAAGILTSSTPLDATTIAANRVKWQNAFDTALDNAFTANAYGVKWDAAAIQYVETRKPSTASDTDPTTYTPSETAVFPMNINSTTDPSAQAAAMNSWVNVPAAVDGSTVTVSTFFTKVKDRLDKIGAVVYTNYVATAPAAGSTLTVTPQLKGTDSEADAVAEYNKAYNEYTNLMNAIKAAGYPNVTFTGTTVNFGTFDATVQNWTNFTTAYNAMVAKGAYSFGLKPPTYDVMFNILGYAGETAAENTANAAVGASTVAANLAVNTPPTGSDGKVYYQVFGRTTTKATVGTLTNTMNRTCNHLTVSVTEITAPSNYKIDNTSPVVVTPAAAEDALSNYGFTDTLAGTSSSTDSPTVPTFESGL